MSAQLQTLYEGKIDFFGQDAVDRWTRVALSIFASLAFVVGLALQSLKMSFAVFGGGVLLVLVLAVPPWPYLNRFPVAWTQIESKKKQ
ncbi:hypothetical protein M408DRAFT_66415 [Serendipita vermifera MAFF 305830]|uniref:Signal peptidase complex subunit 1 n=1 Tax=Serendipita vermifera MAFF 305830 TaxID=933852 RepID=A0A0C2XP05_SERVB|nr:hypothetical protein M408DRAFT_66415 [Serendipita vermifera MAFF 305830]